MIKLKKSQLLRFNKEKIKNKDVLVRVDFNVPIKENKIGEVYRIKSIKETLDFLKIARKIILISHLDDPQPLISINQTKNISNKIFKNKINKYSLKKILPSIEKLLKIKINFLKDLNDIPKEKFNLLENIRLFKGEKECDINFAKNLANLGDIFVFEAFSVCHRKHSSTYLLAKILPTYFGFNFEKEINLLNTILNTSKSKYNNKLSLILGGAKISTKLPLIKKFLKSASLIILTGGLANTFLKSRGFEIGNSLFEKDILEEIKKIKSPKILVPFDFYGLNKNKVFYKFLGDIRKNDKILDIGKESLRVFLKEIKKSKFIVFNGPLGFVEDKRFEKGTLILLKSLSKLKDKFILVGGGDTLSFLENKRIIKKFKISTGGGAMLYYLANETFPIFEK
jgi:phosphoglycerate kinase